MNPVSIKYSLKKKSTYHFIVQTLAIVGGVFSVLGILYHVANSVIDKVKKMWKALIDWLTDWMNENNNKNHNNNIKLEWFGYIWMNGDWNCI